jgi:Flp pilus assembly pilin Flp
MNKLIVAKMIQMQNWMRRRQGQNTVEYLLMLSVVVAVVLATGFALKKFMPEIFEKIRGMIMSAADNINSNK